MANEPGFEVAGEFFAFPTSFRLCDPILVGQITGIKWEEFAIMLDEQDPRSLAGLVAVAVWQKNPRWTRDKVVDYVQAIQLESLTFDGVDDQEDDAGPPATAATSGGRTESSTPTSDDEEASDATPEATGLRLSEITAA